MFSTKKRPPIPLKTDSECDFAPDQNLVRLCTYQNKARVDHSSLLELVCLDILNKYVSTIHIMYRNNVSMIRIVSTLGNDTHPYS